MNFLCSRAAEMPSPLVTSLAQYRYQVFVERLGWELPIEQPGVEQDQFDLPNTVHIVARNGDGQIVGCGRLLPTTGPYLLESVFPNLLNGMPVPRSEQVWELSRFAAMETQGGEAAAGSFMAERVLLQALRFCAERGVTHLIAVSTPPVERLLQRAGVECQRLGPPDLAGGKPVLAFVIAVTPRSIEALECIEAAALNHCAPLRLPRADGQLALNSLLALQRSQAFDVAATPVTLAPDWNVH